jgi:hypothetical protein
MDQLAAGLLQPGDEFRAMMGGMLTTGGRGWKGGIKAKVGAQTVSLHARRDTSDQKRF